MYREIKKELSKDITIDRNETICKLLRIHSILNTRKKGGIALARELAWQLMTEINDQDNYEANDLHNAELAYKN